MSGGRRRGLSISRSKCHCRPGISLGYLILFIVVGVILVTISIEVLASGIIHQVHFMGRQMGRARVLAGKVGFQIMQDSKHILKSPYPRRWSKH